jgi:flagellar biogenesis protein FliO
VGQVWQGLRFVLAFALVLLAAAGASRWVARQSRAGAPGALRLLGAISLGGSRSVCVVHVGRRVLVLGVADHGVRLLQAITDGEEVAAILGGSAPAPLALARNLAGAWSRRPARGLRGGEDDGQ